MLNGMSRLRGTRINLELGPIGRECRFCVVLVDTSRTAAIIVMFALARYVATRPFPMPIDRVNSGNYVS